MHAPRLSEEANAILAQLSIREFLAYKKRADPQADQGRSSPQLCPRPQGRSSFYVAKVRLAMATMGQPNTNVADLCRGASTTE